MIPFKKIKFVLLGLSITSTWGNGHASTYRSLIKGLHACGHRIVFLERDNFEFASTRDRITFPYCIVYLYHSIVDLKKRFLNIILEADCTIVGSFLQDGSSIGRWIQSLRSGITAFYDLNTPVTFSKLEMGDWEYIAPNLIPGYDLYLSTTGGLLLRILELKYNSPKALPLYCSFNPEDYFVQLEEEKWELGYLGTFSSEKHAALKRFLLDVAIVKRNRQFVVAGSHYPHELPLPGNVEQIGYLAPEKHRDFYCSQRFTLNLTRPDMKFWGYSPNIRLFEAAACATPIISDSWEGMDTVFVPGSEILIVKNKWEIIEILNDMPESERRLIGQNAYNRVMTDHTSIHRAMLLESCIYETKTMMENNMII